MQSAQPSRHLPFDVADTWVEPGIREVYHEVQEHQQGAVKDGHAQDGRVVAVIDTGDVVTAYTRDCENLLDNETSREHRRDKRPQHRNDRDEDVAKCVPENDKALRESFCPCRRDVLLAQDLEHGRAHKTCYECYRIPCQRKGGKDNLFYGTPASGRHEVQSQGKDEHEQYRHDEVGNGYAQERDEHHEIVLPAVLPECTPDAQRNADADGKNHRHHSQCSRHRKSIIDDVVDSTVRVLETGTEVTPQKVLHVVDILLPERVVQVIADLEVLDDLSWQLLFAGEGPRWKQAHHEEGSGCDNEDDKNHREHTLQNELKHKTSINKTGGGPPASTVEPPRFFSCLNRVYRRQEPLGSSSMEAFFQSTNPSVD